MPPLREICQKAINKWGKDAQIFVVWEELAELQETFAKWIRGKKTDEEVDEIFDLISEGKTDSLNKKREAQKIYKDLKGKPAEQVKSRLTELAQDDPEMLERVQDTIEETALGLTFKEKSMKQLGVENGARARYIWEEVQQLETPEAKKEYILNLYNKKILSDKVAQQLTALAAGQGR